MTVWRGLICMTLLAGSSVQAVEYYRYIDANGVTAISRQGVPADVIGNGYEVINQHGRVVRVVPRALTPEELQALQQEKQQADIDRQLLRLYSQVSDVERAEERKQAEMDAFIELVRRNMADVREDKSALLNEAGNHERAGRAVPASLLERIAALELREQGYLQEVERYQQLKQDIALEFAADKQRVQQLLKQK